MFAASRNDIGLHLATALKNAHDGRLALNATVSNLLAALISVHESGRATDESLIHFYFLAIAAEPHSFLLVQSKANAVHHKPSRLLSDSQSAANFVGTDTVLGIHDEPNGNHPLVHAERGILKDGANLDGKLLLAALAEPLATRRDKRVLRAIAAWASDLTIRPAQLYGVIKRALRVREESDCFLQRLGKLECVCHA
jgi:hypothetical protein